MNYKISKISRGAMVAVFIILELLVIYVVLRFSRNFVVETEGMGNILGYAILPLLVVIPLVFLLRPLYVRKYEVEIMGGRLRIGNVFDGQLSDISSMFVSEMGNGLYVKISDRNGKEIITLISNIFMLKKERAEVMRLVGDLREKIGAGEGQIVVGNNFKRGGTYYYSSIAGLGQMVPPKPKSNAKLYVVVIVGAFLVLSSGIFGLGAIRGNKDYEVSQGVVTYGGKMVDGAVAKEFVPVSYHTYKDSSNVYFKGVLQPNLDSRTVRRLGTVLIADKGGIYRESMFGKKLKPVGNVDLQTFRMVDDQIYADKDHVYSLDIMASNPLVALSGEQTPDPATVASVGYYFIKDGDFAYFKPLGGTKPRRCDEIDAASLTVVTHQVYKDKNNVYFITRGLVQDGGNEQKGYDILRGAHAPSFRMTGYNTFQDKNTTWTIASGEE